MKCKTCGKFDAMDERGECYRCLFKRNPDDPTLDLSDEDGSAWDEDELSEIEQNREDRHAFYDDDAEDD